MPWRELSHTADLCLEITAADWPQLVAEATAALGARLGEPEATAAPLSRPLSVVGIDREELLVRWLSKIVVWSELEGLLPLRIEITHADIESLTGFAVLTPAKHLVGGIKAVTYHDLKIETTQAGLRTQIVFDL